jgi:large subunit ribosomal protein L15
MPLIRRVPKRGFNSFSKTEYQVVNVKSLERFDKSAIVGPAELKKAGLIGSEKLPVKILGDGKLTKQLTVRAHRLSAGAKKALDSSGSKLELLKN